MRGTVERISAAEVSGWAVEDADLGCRLAVVVALDGVELARGIAELDRPDLAANNLGDGRYGFAIRLPALDDPAALLVAGRLSLEASGGRGAPARLLPTGHLLGTLRAAGLAARLTVARFDELLDEFTARLHDPAGITELEFGLFNAARAHFHEWAGSEAFLRLGLAIAERCGKPLAAGFYKDALAMLAGAPAATPARSVSHTGTSSAYATLAELAAPAPDIALSYVRPRFVIGHSPPSFLEAAGLFPAAAEPAGRRVPLLAFREYAYGEPSWHVEREGQRLDVWRSLFYLDFEQLLEVLDQGGIICVDTANEGPSFSRHWNLVANRSVDALRLPRERLLLVTQNLAYATPPGVAPYCGRIGHAHFYISRGLQLLAKEFATPAQLAAHIRQQATARAAAPAESLRHYLCLNFTPRWQRWATMLHLSRRRALERGFVSFPGAVNFKMGEMSDLERLLPPLRERAELMAEVERLLPRCPLVLDVPADAKASPDFDFPWALMRDSLFQIVTESEASDGDCRRVTEKVLKPIAGLQPFIVIGNPGTLALLREMGFRSFAPFIDEAYDDIADPARRLDAAFAEIDRLLALPIAELQRQVAGLQEVLVHNFLHLLGVAPALFGAGVEARLRRVIAGMVPPPG